MVSVERRSEVVHGSSSSARRILCQRGGSLRTGWRAAAGTTHAPMYNENDAKHMGMEARNIHLSDWLGWICDASSSSSMVCVEVDVRALQSRFGI